MLVFGAVGYIGEGIARAFRRYGYKVYGVLRDESKKDQLLRNEIIPVIGDTKDPSTLTALIQKCAIIVDGIGLTAETNALFDHIVKVSESSQKLYIFTCGIMTFGLGHVGAIDETVPSKTTDPLEHLPKLKFEEKVLSCTKIRTAVARPGFVYGGHGGPVAKILFDVKEELPIVSELRDKRWSWVHVDDLGEGYVKIAKAGSVVNGQLFALAAQDYPSWEELRLAAALASGWKGTVVYPPISAEPERVKQWEGNVIINPAKAFDLLGWRPHHVGVVQEIDLYYQTWKLANKN